MSTALATQRPGILASLFQDLVRRLAAEIVQQVGNSDYLKGMLAMSVIAFGRDAAAMLCNALREWFVGQLRRMWVTVRLEKKDAELLRAWLRERPEVHRSAELAMHSRSGAKSGVRTYEFEPEVSTTTRLYVPLTAGSWRGRWVWITQKKDDAATVSCLGRSKDFLSDLLEEGRALEKKSREKDLTIVQVYDFNDGLGLGWLHPQKGTAKPPGRPISSVVLPECPRGGGMDQAQALLQDAAEFLASEEWYSSRGIPYRRGYLLHGVPGGGKSSLVMALAYELRIPIYVLSLSSVKMTDDKLNSLLQFGMYDPPTILLLEDVDLLHSAVLNRRGVDGTAAPGEAEEERKDGEASSPKNQDRKKGSLTLSGLLNALDGPTATTGRLLFMTTNAKDRLDPALIRSGRVDYEVEFKAANEGQTKRLFQHFYSDLPLQGGGGAGGSGVGGTSAEGGGVAIPASTSGTLDEMATAFARRVTASGRQMTTADVQAHLLKHKASPEGAVEAAAEWLQAADANAEGGEDKKKKSETKAAEEGESSNAPLVAAEGDGGRMEADASDEQREGAARGGCKQSAEDPSFRQAIRMYARKSWENRGSEFERRESDSHTLDPAAASPPRQDATKSEETCVAPTTSDKERMGCTSKDDVVAELRDKEKTSSSVDEGVVSTAASSAASDAESCDCEAASSKETSEDACLSAVTSH